MRNVYCVTHTPHVLQNCANTHIFLSYDALLIIVVQIVVVVADAVADAVIAFGCPKHLVNLSY